MNILGLTQYDIFVYGIVSALLPGIVAIINRPHFPPWAKQIIMAAVAVAAAVVTYGLKNDWDFRAAGLGTALLGVWAATQAAYQYFWKKGLGPAIESNVLGGRKAAPQPETAPLATADIDEELPDDEDLPDAYAETRLDDIDVAPVDGRDVGPADEEPKK